MALGYTKKTWVNGGAPALSAANIQTIDNGIDAVSDEVDAHEAGMTLASDIADETGASTGAKIVSEITKAGYSLSPAVGADNLDNIADGTTYKRIAAAVATALNGLTGVIGRTANKTSAFDWNAMTDDGVFLVATTGISNGPLGGSTYEGMGIVLSVSGALKIQIAIPSNDLANYPFAYRYYYGGVFSASWYVIWNSGNDGNGGQPPAAKSNKTSNATIGWFDAVDCASGASVTLPAGGTFEWFVTTYGATYNSAKSGESAGGAMTGTASANLTMYYKRKTS